MLASFDNRTPQKKHEAACRAIAKRLWMLKAALEGDIVQGLDTADSFPGNKEVSLKVHTLAVLKRCELLAQDMIESPD